MFFRLKSLCLLLVTIILFPVGCMVVAAMSAHVSIDHGREAGTCMFVNYVKMTGVSLLCMIKDALTGQDHEEWLRAKWEVTTA